MDYSSTYSQLSTMIWSNLTTLLKIIYKDYHSIFNLIGSLILIYTCYLLGRWKWPTALQRKIRAINRYEQNILKVSQLLKRRLKQVKATKYLFGVIVVGGVLFNASLWFAENQANSMLKAIGMNPFNQPNQKVAASGATIVFFVLSWIGLKRVLKYFTQIDKRQLSDLQEREESELNEVMKALGPKALQKVKQNQCRKILEDLRTRQFNNGCCSRCEKSHSEYSILKQKYDNYVQFITKVFSFKWCEVCSFKRKSPAYEESQLPIPQKPFSSEDEQVAYRVSQLYKRCEKIDRYFKNLCQKNCSLNYWRESKKLGSEFMAAKMDINTHLEVIHRKKN